MGMGIIKWYESKDIRKQKEKKKKRGGFVGGWSVYSQLQLRAAVT
jgi:hypothetical protein